MQKLGYGPTNSSRSKCRRAISPPYRDPAVILIDQLKEITSRASSIPIETANWHAKVTRKDYSVALNTTGSGVDDPDQQFYENYACGSDRNYSGYCNPELDKSSTSSRRCRTRRSARNWCGRSIAKLQEDAARPIILHELAGDLHGNRTSRR